MPAVKYKLKIDQGATLRKPFTWKAAGQPVDLTGYSARMQIRETLEAETMIHELTTENGGILIGDEPGQFTLYISAEDTAGFNFESAVYDLELIAPDGDVTRILAGDVTLSREVTR
jgi:hypothetical protein